MYHYFKPFFIFFFLINTSPLAAQGLSAEAYVKKGKTAHQANELANAIGYYTLALKVDAYQPSALFNRGVAYAQPSIEKYNKAWEDFNKVLSIDPTDTEATKWRAEMSFKTDRFNLAIQDYTTLLMQEPQNESYLINRGLAYLQVSQFYFAQQDFKAASDINPTIEIVWESLGRCASFLKNYSEAEQAFSHAVALNPYNETALFHLSQIQLKLGKNTEAKVNMEKIAANPVEANATSLALLATCYLSLGELNNAKLTANAARDKEIACSEAYNVLGKIALAELDFAKAQDLFKDAIAWDKNNASAYENMAKTKLHQKEYAPAKAYADQAVALDALSGEAFYIRAVAYEALSYLQNACDDFYKAQSLGFDVGMEGFEFCGQ